MEKLEEGVFSFGPNWGCKECLGTATDSGGGTALTGRLLLEQAAEPLTLLALGTCLEEFELQFGADCLQLGETATEEGQDLGKTKPKVIDVSSEGQELW